MKHNVGSVDKIIRIILGVFVLSLTLWGPQSLWGLIGIVLLATGLMSSCPLYYALNVSTDKNVVKPE